MGLQSEEPVLLNVSQAGIPATVIVLIVGLTRTGPQ